LIFDAAGNLYGAAYQGGRLRYGVIFELKPNADGTWSETVLHTFHNSDGTAPLATLVQDLSGNLYGTTFYGGKLTGYPCTGSGCGVVFQLTPSANGSWKENVLYKFSDRRDGGFLGAGVILDAAGHLYGTTVFGGVPRCNKGYLGCGVVFQLTPTASGHWK